MIKPKFWCGKRVFVTGHTGFKGAWLTLLLEQLGAEICGYSLAPATTPSLYSLTSGSRQKNCHIADIRDRDVLRRTIQAFEPEIVFHLAAQSLVRHSYRYPAETFAINVLGTAHVLDAIRATPCVRVGLIITTDKVYDLSDGLTPRKESDSLGGHDPYSASKAAAEILTASYRESFFSGRLGASSAQIATARSGNVIGGGDWSEDRIVTDIVSALNEHRQVVLRYPKSVRPWLFVLDTLTGYLMLAERLHNCDAGFASAWNLGPISGADMQVHELVEAFAESWGATQGWLTCSQPTLAEAPQLRLDSARAMTDLGWRPSLTQRETIFETATWYHRFFNDKADPVSLCRDAILQHLTRIQQH